MTLKYIALIRKDEDTDFSIDIPDLPGCVSASETMEEAKELIYGALELHLEAMQEDNIAMPEPRSRDEILTVEEDSYIADFMIEIEPINEK